MLPRYTLLLLLIVAFCQCKKGGGTETPTTSSNTERVKREHGQPAGAAISQTIGPAGGTLSSADGGLTLTVPAGAVDASTSFSIQPVENMLQTKGKAYRLLPEGTKFKSPVTLTYSYASLGIRSEEAAWLFPVFQDASGYYYQPKTVEHNAAAKTLTVQTTHFSDWTFTSRVELQAEGHVNNGVAELHKGESVNMTLKKYLSVDGKSDAYNDATPVLEDLGFSMLAKFSWSKSSPSGTLTGQGATARYTAPGAIPAPESLVVSATVEDYDLGRDNNGQQIRQIILVQQVQLLPDDNTTNNDEFFELTEDGSTYRTTHPRFTINGGYLSAIGDVPGRSITLSVKGANAAGSYAYGEPGITGKATIDYTTAGAVYVHFRYDDCANPKAIQYCSGTFTVSKVANLVGEYSEGSFTGEIYAYDYCQSGRKKSVSGRFKVKKNY